MALNEEALDAAVTASSAVQPPMRGDENAVRRRAFLTKAIVGFLDATWLRSIDTNEMEALAAIVNGPKWDLMTGPERRNAVFVTQSHFTAVIEMVRGDELPST